jgi:decaprenyl-phosphate phosphoribosyltransferase
VRAVRVRQWPKNLLVFAVPATAGALGRPGVLASVCGACAVFCLLSSGVYLINDVRDAPEDRRHPTKRHRPIASGAIAPRRAFAAGAAALVLGVSASAAVAPAMVATAVAYAALNIAYTLRLRGIAGVDILVVSAAFVLRLVAGGLAAHVPDPPWLVVSVWLVALFVAAGKRYADVLDPDGRRSRAALSAYSAGGLRGAILITFVGALISYCAWAFAAVAGQPATGPWRELSAIPFAIALWRYRALVAGGFGAAPERILFRDPVIQLAVVGWLLAFATGA